jgi:hypothetical protein
VSAGEPLRIYFTFESTTPGSSNGGLGIAYVDAIKKIRVVVGEDEFARSGPADATILVVENYLEPGGHGGTPYRNQYQFTYAYVLATGYMYCGFAAINWTPIPNPNVAIGGLTSDPPDLATFSVPGYPAEIDHVCIYDNYSTGMLDEVHAFNSSLTRVGGPVGSDVDGDAIDDVDDDCPADPSNTCDASGSGAAVISATAGGTVTTPTAEVSIVAEPGDIASDSTLSVTRVDQVGSGVDLAVGAGTSLGEALASYDLEPDGTQFTNPVSLAVTLDVSPLTPEQRSSIDVYRFADLDGNGVNDAFVPLTASCSVQEEPAETFTAHCLVELNHFSKYAVIAPRDSDGDGVFDSFAGRVDDCQTQDATGFDANDDGCIDSFGGLADLVRKLVVEEVILSELETSLTSKIANASASATKENVCAAIGQLGSLSQQVKAQTGKKISPEAAGKVTNYSESLIRFQRTRLAPGETCGT